MRSPALSLLLLLGAAAAQDTAPPNGPRRIDPGWHALVGGTVHVAPGKVAEGATVVVRDGRIEAVTDGAPPEGARVWDCRGLHVYAGLIDACVPVEAPPGDPKHWNRLVTPRRLARAIDDKTAKELRQLGFTAAVAMPESGIFRGRASLVALGPHDEDPSVPRPAVYREGLMHALAFERSGGAKKDFPTSQMGAIALIRQSLYDGIAAKGLLCFDADDELEALRAAKIARELDRRACIVGSGLEFRRLHAIAEDGLPLIVPLRFPNAPDVSSVGAIAAADLRDLMTWEQAPTNPHRLDASGLTVALTTAKLDKRKRFWRNMRRALRHGLAEDRALAMLTTHPARILGVENELGTIEKGKRANLTVTEFSLFSTDRTRRNFSDFRNVRSVWIDGNRYEVSPPAPGAAGEWTATLEPTLAGPLALRIDHRGKVTVGSGGKEAKAKRSAVRGERLSFAFDHESGVLTLSGTVREDTIRGRGVAADGSPFTWSAKRTAPAKTRKDAPEPIEVPETYGYPFGPYALDGPPPRPDLLIVRDVVIWTCGPQGVIRDGQLESRDGKITYVGPRRKLDIESGKVRLISAVGHHVTPGIVDCHSHTGISKGINDSGQAVTAEVRIGDVTNPDHVSWYRQLAGGVTAANCLHGSANPIGGQNQVVKVRWGVRHPDQMHFEGAKPGIKFALGENVKQSNWGDDFKTRYPQTRMGVETLIRDRFLAAREYLGREDRSKVDLELEALGEILEGKRLIHCHSYRQDEILMLCRIAEEFGFRIGTFQHVLEGYKVAEAIKEHAIGGSAFSDWWAYKVEVQDAIPHNGALMHEVGVVVSFNSDSNDLVRRLNVEAAKAVKYGGVPRADALKFVTLNAAIQLAIDDRVGSLEKGKDADFAIWSGDPLSAYSRCTHTFVDGREHFSLDQDETHREHIQKERQRIIQKILGMKHEEKDDEGGEADGTEEPTRRERAYRRWFLERLRAGGDPYSSRCGECGCFEFEEVER